MNFEDQNLLKNQMPSLIRLRNGEKVQNTFSAQEYASRMAKVRKYMAENSIDAVLFTSYHNINYYSDFLYCSFGRFYGLAVTHDKTTIIAANIDGAQPWRKGVADDMLTYTDWQRGNYFRAVQACIPNKGRVPASNSIHLPIERLEMLKASLPNVESSTSHHRLPIERLRLPSTQG